MVPMVPMVPMGPCSWPWGHAKGSKIHPEMGPKGQNGPEWIQNHPFGPITGPN